MSPPVLLRDPERWVRRAAFGGGAALWVGFLVPCWTILRKDGPWGEWRWFWESTEGNLREAVAGGWALPAVGLVAVACCGLCHEATGLALFVPVLIASVLVLGSASSVSAHWGLLVATGVAMLAATAWRRLEGDRRAGIRLLGVAAAIAVVFGMAFDEVWAVSWPDRGYVWDRYVRAWRMTAAVLVLSMAVGALGWPERMARPLDRAGAALILPMAAMLGVWREATGWVRFGGPGLPPYPGWDGLAWMSVRAALLHGGALLLAAVGCEVVLSRAPPPRLPRTDEQLLARVFD